MDFETTQRYQAAPGYAGRSSGEFAAYGGNQYAPAPGGPYAPQAGVGQHVPGQAIPGQAPPPSGFPGLGNYAQFLDPNAPLGSAAFSYGRDYVTRHIPPAMSTGALKYYFQVSNWYVAHKLGLVLFPWRHKPWTRTLQRVAAASGGSDTPGTPVVDGYATARDDINAPDMYIPYMAFLTYVLLKCVLAGAAGSFRPQLIQQLMSSTVAVLLAELLLLKAGTYLLSADSKLLDLFAYAGYKFVGIILTMLTAACLGRAKWAVFVYTASANSFFLLRSLRYVLLPDSSAVGGPTTTVSPGQRQRRIQFLFVYSFIVQFLLMWVLI